MKLVVQAMQVGLNQRIPNSQKMQILRPIKTKLQKMIVGLFATVSSKFLKLKLRQSSHGLWLV